MKYAEMFAKISVGISGLSVAWLACECAYFVYRYGEVFFSPQFTGG